jgi:two-component system CheB/CheR fusion protein
MDLVSCRNLLIYLGPEIQNRLIPTFHYALRPGGYLFLGTSESISQHDDLFAPVDKKHRIFRAREHARRTPRLPMLIANGLSSGTHISDNRIGFAASYPLRQAVEAQVLERFAPAHVVVNGEGDVVYYSAKTGKYLEAAQGAPTRQVLVMARRGLRLDLRSALKEAMENRRTVVRQDIAVDEEDDRVQFVDMIIEPLVDRGNDEPLFQVSNRVRQSKNYAGRYGRSGTRAARHQGAPSIHNRRIRNRARGIEIFERGTRLSQRGIAVLQRGTRSVEGGIAVSQ